MTAQLTLVYWKSGKFWLGKLLEHPEIMTQGETLEELEENIKDAYRLMVLDDVPEEHQVLVLFEQCVLQQVAGSEWQRVRARSER